MTTAAAFSRECVSETLELDALPLGRARRRRRAAAGSARRARR